MYYNKMVSIHNLIAAISPDVYCNSEVRKEVKRLVKEKGFLEAAEIAEPFETDVHFDYDSARADALSNWGLKAPSEKHSISYDSPTDGIEPVYFWILDFISNLFKDVEKITDNFVSSPGSGHFSEIQGKATQMQQEVARTMGNVNAVIKSILNLVYDLKEFKLRLDPYDSYKSKDEKKKFIALLSLKQIWLDNVDLRKGRGSINALASGELDFTTLRDAFMSIKSQKSIDNLDLNNRVKRILIQRAEEFFRWIEESEKSLKQRYNIERNYLKSQVNILKLYSRWVKPYLKAAQKLEQQYESSQAALVTTFNTILLELRLLAKSEYQPEDDVNEGLLPSTFKKIKGRKYYSVLITELNFRGIPQRIQQRGDWAFGGKVDVKFTSYSLNDQELKVLKEELEKDDLGDIMSLIQGSTDDSLKQIQEDIDEILEDKKKEEEKLKGSSNPFFALFSFLKTKKTQDSKSKEDFHKGIKPDNKYEQVLRSQSIIDAREKCFTLFDVYKKTHGMPSHASAFEAI
jgi:hypothetical protein